MNVEDRLDAALGGDILAFAASPEVPGLVDTGDEVIMSAGAGSFGLVEMRERARLIGAELEVTSAPHGGTRVSVRVPLEHHDAAATA